MLSSLNQSNLRLTRRTAQILAILVIAGMAVPALNLTIANGVAGQTDKPAAGGSAQRDGGKSGVVPDVGSEPREAGEIVAEEFFPRPTTIERILLAALDTPVDIDFKEKPFDECLAELADKAKINIVIDRTKLEEEGVALDQPITLKLRETRLGSVLNLLLRPVQLTFVNEDDVLKITTAQSAADTLITRTYPIGDLCPELKEEKEPADKKAASFDNRSPHIRFAYFQGFGGGGLARQPDRNDRKITRFSNLMDAITRTIEPDSWDELSGPGSIVAVAATNCVVIRQTQAVHRQILQLLRDLRAAKRVPQAAPGRVNQEPAKRSSVGAAQRQAF